VGLAAAFQLNRTRRSVPRGVPPAEKIDPVAELAAVDQDDTEALRAFAKKHHVRLNPNKYVKAEKLLATIRTELQRSEDSTVGTYG
jgi:hypothetical protein